MRRSIKGVHAALLFSALLVLPRTSAAQIGKWFELGFPAVGPDEASIELLLLGVRVGSLKPLVPGIDCSIVTLPVVLTHGVLVLATGLDVAFPIRFGGATLIPRAGGSALTYGPAEERFAEVIAGYNAGVGLVARTSATTTVRLDVTHHWLAENLGVTIVSLGFQMH
jgi:hypothetical protein